MKEFVKKFIGWLATTKFLQYPRKIVKRIISYAIQSKNVNVSCCDYLDNPGKLKAMDLVKKIRNERELCIEDCEGYQIFMAVKNTAKVNGDIAEIGVYKGGSAALICEVKENKTLYLFDTFEGLPDLCEMDNLKVINKGQFLGEFEDVKAYLKKYSNVYIYKGLFPSTADPIKNKRFSFVNLDVDLYKSTLSCLEFFYSKMNKGGIIISHDYTNTNAQGVRKAFDDFFKEKPEPIIELSGSQCLIVKC